MKKTLDWRKYLDTAANVVSEGIVMLKNDNNALPLRADDTVSVFGRIVVSGGIVFLLIAGPDHIGSVSVPDRAGAGAAQNAAAGEAGGGGG